MQPTTECSSFQHRVLSAVIATRSATSAGGQIPPLFRGSQERYLHVHLADLAQTPDKTPDKATRDYLRGIQTRPLEIYRAGAQTWRAPSDRQQRQSTVLRDHPADDNLGISLAPDDEAGRSALWPLLIEKAYIQDKGGVEEITSVSPGEAVDELTDQSAQELDPREQTSDWLLARLVKAHNDKRQITISSPDKKDASQEMKDMSDRIPELYLHHAYAVVDADDKGRRIKLFNPWGNSHPNDLGWLDIAVIRTFFCEININ